MNGHIESGSSSWRNLAAALGAETNLERRIDLSYQMVGFREDPELQEWARQRLITGIMPEDDSIGGLIVTHLFWMLKRPYGRNEVEAVDPYFNSDNDSHSILTSNIILEARNELTPEERNNFSARARTIYDQIEDHQGAYNSQADYIEVVGEFAGAEQKNWYCEIITKKTITPTADSAYKFAVMYDPNQASQSLLDNALNNHPHHHVTHKAWIVTHLMPLEDYLNDKSVLAYANYVTDIYRTLEQMQGSSEDDQIWADIGIGYMKELSQSIFDTKRLLSRLPPDHPLQQTLKVFLNI